MPEVSYWKCSPQAKIKFVHPIQEQWTGKLEGENPALLGFLYQFQELSFSHCQQHPSIPIVTSPRLSNWSKREAGMLQTETRGSVTQAPGTHPVCLKHSHSISLPLIPRLPDGSLLSPFNVLLRQWRGYLPRTLHKTISCFLMQSWFRSTGYWSNHVPPTTLCINVCWMKESSGIEIKISKIWAYRSEIKDGGQRGCTPKRNEEQIKGCWSGWRPLIFENRIPYAEGAGVGTGGAKPLTGNWDYFCPNTLTKGTAIRNRGSRRVMGLNDIKVIHGNSQQGKEKWSKLREDIGDNLSSLREKKIFTDSDMFL